MREVGVRTIVGPCAAGSLQAHVHPGELVVVDQLVDRTWGRPDTFFDGPEVHHVSFADPYDAAMRSSLVAAARRLELPVHDGGTMVVVQGPRFSTRAESRWFTSMGWEVINMRVQLDHLAPTAVGGKVKAEATLEKVEGRRLIFTVSVSDNRGLIAAGKVTRVVVNVERFLDKAAE